MFITTSLKYLLFLCLLTKVLIGFLFPLLARSIIVLDENGKILHTEQVYEVVEEPNYKAALEALMDA